MNNCIWLTELTVFPLIPMMSKQRMSLFWVQKLTAKHSCCHSTAHSVSTSAYRTLCLHDTLYLPALLLQWVLSRPAPATCDPVLCAGWDSLPVPTPERLSSGPACWQTPAAAQLQVSLLPATRQAPEGKKWKRICFGERLSICCNCIKSLPTRPTP